MAAITNPFSSSLIYEPSFKQLMVLRKTTVYTNNKGKHGVLLLNQGKISPLLFFLMNVWTNENWTLSLQNSTTPSISELQVSAQTKFLRNQCAYQSTATTVCYKALHPMHSLKVHSSEVTAGNIARRQIKKWNYHSAFTSPPIYMYSFLTCKYFRITKFQSQCTALKKKKTF